MRINKKSKKALSTVEVVFILFLLFMTVLVIMIVTKKYAGAAERLLGLNIWDKMLGDIK
jgi:hypothetical protein